MNRTTMCAIARRFSLNKVNSPMFSWNTHPVIGADRRFSSQRTKISSVTSSSDSFDPRTFFDAKLDHDAMEKLRRALLYRSKQTGWLETDVVMGRWADENLSKLSKEELKEYSDIVKEEIIDIFKWMTGQTPVPPHLQTSVMKRLQDFALKK